MRGLRGKMVAFGVLALLAGPIAESFGAVPDIDYLGSMRARLVAPVALAADAAGNLYVSDEERDSVTKIDPSGRLLLTLPGLNVVGSGLAVTADGQRLYVGGGQSVQVLDGASGQPLGLLGGKDDEFGEVTGIAVTSAGEVMVADNRIPAIRVYDGAGVFLRQFGGSAVAEGSLMGIAALAVEVASDEVYAVDNTDPAMARVQVFSAQGLPLRSLGRTDFGVDPVDGFGGMTFDAAGRGYFLLPGQHQIGVLELPAAPLLHYTETLPGAPPLTGLSAAVYVAYSSRLYVICHGGRIEMFGIDSGQVASAPTTATADAALEPLLDKLFQVDQLVRAVAPELSALVSAIEERIWARDSNGGALLVADLRQQAPDVGGLPMLITELEMLLR